MAKDLVKEGVAFALGLARISARQFDGVIKGLEKRHKVSSKEGEAMVRGWAAQQLLHLQRMQERLKREVLKTRLYSSNDLAKLNGVLKRISAEIARLQKKKKKAESSGRKAKGKKKKRK